MQRNIMHSLKIHPGRICNNMDKQCKNNWWEKKKKEGYKIYAYKLKKNLTENKSYIVKIIQKHLSNVYSY